MPTSPRRRWFQFNLRRPFVVLTIFAAFMAYQINWIHQRRQFLAEQDRKYTARYYPWVLDDAEVDESSRLAPGILWLFGERGLGELQVMVDAPDSDHLSQADVALFRRAKRLFPEADVSICNAVHYSNGSVSTWWAAPEVIPSLAP